MTRDEVKKIIADEIGWKLVTPKLYSANTYAEAVLAAFAARGLIIGEPVTLRDVFQRDAEHIGIGQTGIDDEGLALVRVVPNE